MSTKERLKEFLSSQKIGRNKFEKQIGLSIGYMSTKSITITSDVIEKTIEAYPNINIEWLLTGKGDMTKEAPIITSSDNLFYLEEIKSLKAELKEAYKEIGKLEGENNIMREQIGLSQRKNGKTA